MKEGQPQENGSEQGVGDGLLPPQNNVVVLQLTAKLFCIAKPLVMLWHQSCLDCTLFYPNFTLN